MKSKAAQTLTSRTEEAEVIVTFAENGGLQIKHSPIRFYDK
jgi:hypothetical protein